VNFSDDEIRAIAIDVAGDKRDLTRGPNLIERAVCFFCHENFILRGGRKYVQLIEMQDALDVIIKTVPGLGPQRVCINLLPIEDTVKVCLYPCWANEQDHELANYAHAPAAGELQYFKIG
jgi:hypothetical protein